MELVAIGSIVGIFLVLVLAGGLWASRYKKVGPHQAMVVSGKGGQSAVTGGGKFVLPFLYTTFELDLRAQQIDVRRDNIYTKNRVPVSVDAALVYKVKGDGSSILLAAQSLQGHSHEEISGMIQSVAEGAFRDICGKMTPEEINEDREAFQKQVTEVARGHFEKIGIELVSFVVRQISDPNHYFDNLGAPRLAEVDQIARQKKAEANQAATVTEAEQKQKHAVRTAETEAEILEAQKKRNVKEQEFKAETAKATARAEQAGPEESATAQQKVVEAQTALAEKQAERKQKELLSSVVRPAEAERDSQIAKAEGDKKAMIARAEGDAERIKITGAAEGEAAQKKGEGEAAATKAKLVAEAEGLERKAKAMGKFNDATMRLEIAKELIRTLPDLVKAAATPIAGVESIKVIDFGGNGGGADAGSGGPLGRLLGVTPKTLSVLDETLKTTLGMSLTEMIQLVRKGEVAGLAAGGAERTDEEETSRHTTEKKASVVGSTKDK